MASRTALNVLLMLSEGEDPPPRWEIDWHVRNAQAAGVTWIATTRTLRGLTEGESTCAFYGSARLDPPSALLGFGTYVGYIPVGSPRSGACHAQEIYANYGTPKNLKGFIGVRDLQGAATRADIASLGGTIRSGGKTNGLPLTVANLPQGPAKIQVYYIVNVHLHARAGAGAGERDRVPTPPPPPAPPPPTPRPPPRDPAPRPLGKGVGVTHALVIGVSTYEDPEIPDLPEAARDARAVHRLLIDRAGLSESRCTLLCSGESGREPTFDRLSSTVRSLFHEARDEELLIYFAGHSSVHDEQLFLYPGDVRITQEVLTAYPVESILMVFRHNHAHGRTPGLLVLDSCKAGLARGSAGMPADLLEPDRGGYGLVLACRAGQVAVSDSGHGLFTGTLINVLGDLLTGDWGRVSYNDVFERTRSDVYQRALELQRSQLPVNRWNDMDPTRPFLVRREAEAPARSRGRLELVYWQDGTASVESHGDAGSPTATTRSLPEECVVFSLEWARGATSGDRLPTVLTLKSGSWSSSTETRGALDDAVARLLDAGVTALEDPDGARHPQRDLLRMARRRGLLVDKRRGKGSHAMIYNPVSRKKMSVPKSAENGLLKTIVKFIETAGSRPEL